MTRKNIKVPEDLFMALRDDKDDQQSWPHYLEEQCLHESAETAACVFGEVSDDGFEDLAEALATVEERTGRIERTLEDLGGRR